MENEYKKILDVIDTQAQVLVGVLLKRIEVLEKEKVLTPSLYKSLIKENIYENSRYLKKLIKLHLEIGKVTLKPRKD